ncbi:LOW QUALITY PROTEIN: hypothetical protein QYF61_026819 [Mycteria americana]|uniref:ribonuclease H n=1 Tax=Mycteria americana TaxID=33587 RepID=A0AAN7NYX6_MYCAM|nr:LOW QUALITY PROTEIN: hypothetical protein QYF61_026819 [Mycteria americana]
MARERPLPSRSCILPLAAINTPRSKEDIPAEVKDAVTPLVRASGIPGWSKLAEPVKVVLKPGSKLVRQKQYLIKWEARKGLEELITTFLDYGLLIECESEYNTPILPVKKQNGKEYSLVQDLRAVNQVVQDIHPVVANPSTLLTSLKEKHKWFTVLDLKDAFFCIPLDKDSQAYLPLNGKAPPLDTRHNSPGRCYLKGSKIVLQYLLAKEFEVWEKENSEGIILHCVDDILIAAETWEDCLQATISLLNFLGQAGYRVSRSKAQIGKETVIYLGFEISQGQRRLGAGRKEAICQVPEPRTIRELRTFLGMTAFKNLKKALMSTPALGLPDLAKPFELFQLDNVSKGWPGCLRAVVATVLLIQEARKLTMGQKISVCVPHMVISVLEQKGGHWLSPSHMLKYQVTLLEQDDVELKTTTAVNPAMFLSSKMGESLHHDCLQDLKDEPMPNADLELFMDGSSFV